MENLKIRIIGILLSPIIIVIIILNWIWENWKIVEAFIIAFAILLIVLIVIQRKKKKKEKYAPVKLSKKFRKKYPIIIQYVPPKWINSAEAWLLYNCKVEPTDLTSLLYRWAYEGFIEIQNWSDSKNLTKIILKKIKNLPEDRPFFEKNMFNCIFIGGTDTKVISSSNQLKYALFLEDLRTHWINKWWFEKVKVPLFMKILYGLLIISTIVYLFLDFEIFFGLLLRSIAMSWYIFGYEKTQLTDKWAELVSYIIWYRNFISNCDENQIKILLKEDPLFLDRSLPYATAFWLETQFLKKITPLVEDWNAKYLCWEKVLPLSDVLDWTVVKTASTLFNLYRLIESLDKINLFKLFFKF